MGRAFIQGKRGLTIVNEDSLVVGDEAADLLIAPEMVLEHRENRACMLLDDLPDQRFHVKVIRVL